MPMFSQVRRNREFFIEDVTAPMSQTIGASFDSAHTFGLSEGLSREVQKYAAGLYEQERLSQDQIDETVGDLPLTVREKDLVTSRQLQLMMEDKKRELQHQQIMSRSKDGVLAGAAHLTAGLAASIMDPGDLLVSMVPVVGQARYASMLAKAGTALGRAGVRAKVGVAGGLFGATLAEPFVYGMAQSRQAEYDMYDSLLNITFGGIMGGGLHVAGGAIKDRFFRAPKGSNTSRIIDDLAPETREHALRTAYAQMASGERIDIEPILGGDPRYSYLTGTRLGDDLPEGVGGRKSVSATDSVLRGAVDEIEATVKNDIEPRILPKGEVKALKGEVKNLKHEIARAEKEIKGRSKTDPVRKGHEKNLKKNRKRVTELDAKLKEQSDLAATRKDLLNDVGKSRKIIEAKDKPDLRDWPVFLREALDEELNVQHQKASPQKLQAAIQATMKPKQAKRNFGPSPEQAKAVNKQIESRKGKTEDEVLDEILPEVESNVRKIADDAGIADELAEIDEGVKKLKEDSSMLDEALRTLAACRGTNG